MMREDTHARRSTRLESEGQSLSRALRPRGPVRLALGKRVVNGATVLEVGGELDVLTAAKLGAEIDDVVRKETGKVILDLRGTGFVDSAGLQLLLSAQRRLSGRERALSVVCGPGQVRRVIERARLLEALGVVGSLGELDDAA